MNKQVYRILEIIKFFYDNALFPLNDDVLRLLNLENRDDF